MPGEVEGVARVRAHRGLDLACQIVRNLFPCFPPARVDIASTAEEIGFLKNEVDVRDPVLKRATSSEGHHQSLVGAVCGEEASRVAVIVRTTQLAMGLRSWSKGHTDRIPAASWY